MLERARPRILWPSLAGFSADHGRRRSARLLLRRLPALLRGLAIGALAVALARPQTVGGVIRIAGQGVAIVVALDQSSSMKTRRLPRRSRDAPDQPPGSGQGHVHPVRRGPAR